MDLKGLIEENVPKNALGHPKSPAFVAQAILNEYESMESDMPVYVVFDTYTMSLAARSIPIVGDLVLGLVYLNVKDPNGFPVIDWHDDVPQYVKNGILFGYDKAIGRR